MKRQSILPRKASATDALQLGAIPSNAGASGEVAGWDETLVWVWSAVWE